jgi:hypothetical protein
MRKAQLIRSRRRPHPLTDGGGASFVDGAIDPKPAPKPRDHSWWINLDRAAFQAEIKKLFPEAGAKS